MLELGGELVKALLLLNQSFRPSRVRLLSQIVSLARELFQLFNEGTSKLFARLRERIGLTNETQQHFPFVGERKQLCRQPPNTGALGLAGFGSNRRMRGSGLPAQLPRDPGRGATACALTDPQTSRAAGPVVALGPAGSCRPRHCRPSAPAPRGRGTRRSIPCWPTRDTWSFRRIGP